MEKVEKAKKLPGAQLLTLPVFIAAGLAAGLIFAWVIFKNVCYVATDDAFIDGNVLMVSPKVSAHVLNIPVEDNQAVAAGAVLVELDPRDFEIRGRMAAAELEGAKAEEEQARQDSDRYAKLSEADEISKQQMDRALLRARIAAAKVAEAEAALQKSALDLSYTRIASPVAGHVARKSVTLGAFVQPGQSLMAVVSDKKWVVANFKETDLTRLRPGQKAALTIDAYPGHSWAGHVDSVQRGTGARFRLFPPENAAGNYVKVVQRVPVKIVFDETVDDRYPLSVGMSVVPEVKVR